MGEGIELSQTLLKQSAEILKATRETSGLTGSSMPISHLELAWKQTSCIFMIKGHCER